jgi:RNA polymerase sigma-32 factor
MRADEGESGEWQDWLVDDHDGQETCSSSRTNSPSACGLLNERHVGAQRPREGASSRRVACATSRLTLEELSQEYNVSRERIRQIEVRAFEKVQDAVKAAAKKQAQALRTIDA